MLRVYGLKHLPVIFCSDQSEGSIYILPVVLSGLENLPNEEFSTKGQTLYHYKQSLDIHLINVTVSCSQLTQLYYKNFPIFLDRDFCLNFLSQTLTPTLSKFTTFTPRRRTRSISEISDSQKSTKKSSFTGHLTAPIPINFDFEAESPVSLSEIKIEKQDMEQQTSNDSNIDEKDNACSSTGNCTHKLSKIITEWVNTTKS